MVSTVTTTVTTIAAQADDAALAVIGVLLLIGLLVSKELAQSSQTLLAERLGRSLNVGILPMLFVFALIVLSKVQSALQ